MLVDQDAYKWYALFVMTGEEDNVKERILYRLKDKDLNVIVPKRLLRERRQGVWENKLRTLFPGYVLLNGYVGIEDYYSLKGIPGLITILKDRNGPLAMSENELGIISRLIKDDATAGISAVLIEGSRVVVVDGPLLGLDGYIQSIDKRKGRVKVRLSLYGEVKLVELSVSMVQSA